MTVPLGSTIVIDSRVRYVLACVPQVMPLELFRDDAADRARRLAGRVGAELAAVRREAGVDLP
ncbi:hypothetical protein GCM10020220_102390 [Nonomuraea rubra]